MHTRALRARAALLAVWMLGAAVPATAQDYPTKNVTIAVPLAAGTGMDTLARVYAEDLAKALGRPVVVENQPGAALMLAAQNVAKATPDGHTLVIVSSPVMAVNQTLYKKINYDPEKDFVPISLYVKSPFLVVVNPGLGVNSMADLIKLAKERAATPINYATSGAGTLQHLTMESLKQEHGFAASHVPYRNSVQILTDVVGGHLNAALSEVGASLSLVKDGKMKALAITSGVRHPQMGDVPTLAEAMAKPGLEAVSWHALLAPAATPKPIVDRLAAEMKRITSAPAFQKRISDIGLIPIEPMSPEQTNTYIRGERTRWSAVVKKLGLEGSQ